MDIKTTEAITSVVVVLSCTTSVVPMLLIHRLEAESRGDAIGIPCVAIVRVAVRVHNAEVDAAAAIRRTQHSVLSGTITLLPPRHIFLPVILIPMTFTRC